MRSCNPPTVDELFERQRTMLGTPDVVTFIAVMGDDAPLWPYGPTAAQLRRAVYPMWPETILRILSEAGRRVPG